jgi:hypothetical protein
MANPLQLLIGTDSLRNRITRQTALLHTDIERVQTRTDTLKQSAANAVISPLGLAATAVLGFATGRALQRSNRKHQDKNTSAAAIPSALWWELLLPVGFAWVRRFAIAQMQRSDDKKSP